MNNTPAQVNDWLGSRYAFEDDAAVGDRVEVICRGIDAIANLDETSSAPGMTWADLKDVMRAQAKILEEPYRLVVAGVQNSGKSTVVNVLLGQWLMPSLSRNVDAVLTRIQWGEDLAAEVVYRNGTTRVATVEEVRRLVDQKHADLREEQGRIDYCVLRVPNSNLKTFEIVNTPGLEDKTHVSARTRAFFKEADAILWVFDANRVEEVRIADDVLSLCRDQGHRIVALLNQIDLVVRSSGEPGVDQVLQRFGSLFGGAYQEVFPVAARDAADGLGLRPLRDPLDEASRRDRWAASGFESLDAWFQEEMFGRDKRHEKRSGVAERLAALRRTASGRASTQVRETEDWLAGREEEQKSLARILNRAARKERRIERELHGYADKQARRMIQAYLSVIETVAQEVIGLRSVFQRGKVAEKLQERLDEEVARILPQDRFCEEVADTVTSVILDGWDEFVDEIEADLGEVKVEAQARVALGDLGLDVEIGGLGRVVAAVVKTAAGLGLKTGGERLVREGLKRSIQLMVRRVVEQILKLLGKRFTVTLLRNLAKWINPAMWVLTVADLEAARRDIRDALNKGRAQLVAELQGQEDAIRSKLAEQFVDASRETYKSIKRGLEERIGAEQPEEQAYRRDLDALHGLLAMLDDQMEDGE